MAEKTISNSSIRKITLLIQVCFFLSGLTGLVYEILWTRMIIKIIGSAPFAISIVLTVFMGGLGLGSFLASRTIDRIKEPIKLVRLYGVLEVVIGAYGLVLPFLLVAFRPLYATLYNRLFAHFMLYNFLTFVGCSILLCIPVICMGATLPILCRFYVTKLSHLGAHAGRLYGLNTIGAAFGALLCGFWLISLLGMSGTLIFAVFINGIIGLFCLLVRYKPEARETGEEVGVDLEGSPQKDTELSEYPGAVSGALVIFAVSGFCAMAYEVIWAKLLGLIIAPTTYSFTIVLVTFILGLALGSMFFGWLADKTKKIIWLLISTQIAAALFALVISQLLGNSQLFFGKLSFNFQNQFMLLSILKAVILFSFMILPTLCLGATFPLVGKIYTQSVSKIGRSIGVAYTINSIGAVLGSFCAGFVLVPLVGKENGLSLVVGLQFLTSLVIAVVITFKKKQNLLKLVCVSVPALAGLFFCFYFPMWDRYLLSQGRYHRFEKIREEIVGSGWLESLLYGPEMLTGVERYELVYYGDGIGGFTTVLKFVDPFGNPEYVMVNSGKADASSRGDMRTQTLCAHFPMLFHRNPMTVMVLGLASGVTAGEVLCYPIEKLDVIDINRQVIEGSKFFAPWNNNVLSNPKTSLIIQDGRAHLQLTKQKYDVIISEPSNPWMAGLATLFTYDFFTLAKNQLNDSGVFVQFIHSYQMDWSTFSLVGRTFAKVFPNSLLLSATPSIGGDYLLVGFKGENQLSLDNAKQNLPYARKSKNITLSDPELLYRLIVSENLQELFGEGAVNTDSRPRLEFAAPKLIYASDPMIEENIRSKKRVNTRTKEITEQLVTNVDKQIDFVSYTLSVHAPFKDMIDLSKATSSQKERFFKLIDRYCADSFIDPAAFKDDELEKRCHKGQSWPGGGQSVFVFLPGVSLREKRHAG
jgi:spermidine synthase